MITFRQLQRMSATELDSLSDLCPITVDGEIRWQLLKAGRHADSQAKLGTNPKTAKNASGTTPDDSHSSPCLTGEKGVTEVRRGPVDSQAVVKNSVYREKYGDDT